MPDGREAALVVYNVNVGTREKPEWQKQVHYQPMVQGIVKLMRNSGEIADVDAFIVCKNDQFSFRAGIDKMPTHDADWFGDRGEPIGVWAFVKLKSEEVKVTMLTRDRVMRVATRSRVAKNYDPKQGADWEEWWKKAAIRNVSKYAPKTSQLEQALKQDDNEFDFAEDDVNYAPTSGSVNPVNEQPKTETRAAKVVKKKSQNEAATAAEVADDEAIDAEVIDTEKVIDQGGVDSNEKETEEDGLPM